MGIFSYISECANFCVGIAASSDKQRHQMEALLYRSLSNDDYTYLSDHPFRIRRETSRNAGFFLKFERGKINNEDAQEFVAEFCEGIGETLRGLKKEDFLCSLKQKEISFFLAINDSQASVPVGASLESVQAAWQSVVRGDLEMQAAQAARHEEELCLGRRYLRGFLSEREFLFRDEAARLLWENELAKRPAADVAFVDALGRYLELCVEGSDEPLGYIDWVLMPKHTIPEEQSYNFIVEMYYEVRGQKVPLGEVDAPLDVQQWAIGLLAATWQRGDELAYLYQDMLSDPAYPYLYLVRDLVFPSSARPDSAPGSGGGTPPAPNRILLPR